MSFDNGPEGTGDDRVASFAGGGELSAPIMDTSVEGAYPSCIVILVWESGCKLSVANSSDAVLTGVCFTVISSLSLSFDDVIGVRVEEPT